MRWGTRVPSLNVEGRRCIRRGVESAPVRWPLIIGATILIGATIAIAWLVAVSTGPAVCAATYPGPRYCFSSDRAGMVLVTSVAVAAIYIETVTLALVKNRRHHNPVVSGVAILADPLILSYVAVAWIPAFASSSRYVTDSNTSTVGFRSVMASRRSIDHRVSAFLDTQR